MQLAAYRKLRGLTPAQAAAELSTSTVTYWRWESNGVLPRTKRTQAIEAWSQGAVTINDLMENFKCKQAIK